MSDGAADGGRVQDGRCRGAGGSDDVEKGGEAGLGREVERGSAEHEGRGGRGC